MQHLIHLFTNPVVIVLFIILLNYHHLPRKIWDTFGVFFKWLWIPVVKLDKYLFDTSAEVKEKKKNRFKKIVSPFGKLFLLLIAFIVSIGDELFITPATKLVDKILKSEKMKKVITFIESQDIIVLRIFVGVPFLMMELTGILAGFLILSMPLVAIIIYLLKFLWVIPFKFIDKVGHDKLSKDIWYSGLKITAVKVIDAVTSLNAIKNLKNKIVKVKNFLNDSEHNTMLEIKLRKKILLKVIKEVWSLKHLSSELAEGSDIELVFFSPKQTNKLNKLKENPNDTFLRNEIVDYILTETGVSHAKSSSNPARQD